MRSFIPVALLLAAPAAAQEAAPAAPAAAVDPFAQALAARQVADFARRTRDAAAMVTAAQMLREIPFRDAAAGGVDGGGFTAAGLFAEARTLAGSNAPLLAQIDFAERAAGSRGVTASAFGKGLVRSVQTVDPRGAYRFNVTAAGGTPLRVGAIGDVGTALAMRVQDAGGRTVCMDDNADYAPVCQLTPKANAQYRIDILNKSPAKSRAVILSN
jgi:hypothetical protein